MASVWPVPVFYQWLSKVLANGTKRHICYIFRCLTKNLVSWREKKMAVLSNLTHFPLVPHICVTESGQHWFKLWLIAYSGPNHYLNQCWIIVNLTLSNKLQRNFYQNRKLPIHENAFENAFCQMAAISSRRRWVKKGMSPAIAIMFAILRRFYGKATWQGLVFMLQH